MKGPFLRYYSHDTVAFLLSITELLYLTLGVHGMPYHDLFCGPTHFYHLLDIGVF